MLKLITSNKHNMSHRFNSLKTSLVLLLLISTVIGFSQKNSPWKKLTNQTVSGVYLGLGRHQYSLDGGQGFSVYLKNYNPYPVVVSGKVIAKTLCGSEVASTFTTTLAPEQESSGGNYADSSNSQTGVVTKDECAGKKTFISAKHAVTNRIQDVYVKDVVVQGGNGAQIQSSSLQPNIPVKSAVPNFSNVVTPSNPNTTFYKQKYDSLTGVVGFLKERNVTLQDSLINLKSQISKGIDFKKDSLLQSLPAIKKKDKYRKIVFTNPYIGIGWEHIPMILNQDSVTGTNVKASSTSDASSHPILIGGVIFNFFDSLPVSFQVNPFASYGINLGSGTCGNHFAGGGLLRLLAGLKYNAPVKLFVEGGIIYRNGSLRKNITVSNIKTQQTGSYEYNVTRIGGGIQYQWNGGNAYLRPGIFLETPSIGTSTSVLSLEVQFSNRWKAAFNYADNYFAVGTKKYQWTDNTQNYFNLRLTYNIGKY